MKIGVSGAGGKLGQATVAALLQASDQQQAVAISRSPKTISGQVESRFGDYDRSESLVAAYAGLERLFLIPSNDLTPGTIGRQITDAIEAAVRAGVQHIIVATGAGTLEEATPGLGSSYWVAEQHLMKSSPRWTILRMNFFAESLEDEVGIARHTRSLVGFGAERVAFVARADVGGAAAGLLLGRGRPGSIYNATGPAALSGEDRAAVVSELLSSQVHFLPTTETVYRKQLDDAGVPAHFIDAMCEIKRGFVSGKYDVVTTHVERLSGRAAVKLADALKAPNL